MVLAIPLGIGCDSTPTGGSGVRELGGPESSGRIVIDGSSTVYPISHEAKAAYERRMPNVEVLVSIHGTTGGFTRYLKGEVDIIDASRPAHADEERKARELGLDWTPLTVGYDGVTVVVNRTNNFVKALSVDQLRRLFDPKSTIKTWKELDPSWPDRAIKLYVPDRDSGTFDFFTEAINGAPGAQRSDTVTSADDGTLAKDIGGDPDALGYFGFAYYAANKGDIRAIPIQANADADAVEPLLETLIARKYIPLGRPLYVYVKNKSMARPEVADFVTYYSENVSELASLAGYVPPSDEDLAANKSALAALGRDSKGESAPE